MKTERKPITIRLQPKLHSKLQSIQEETGLSQSKVIEMLIENHSAAKVQPQKTTPITQPQVQPFTKEEILAEVQSLVQSKIDEAIKHHLDKKEEVATIYATMHEEEEEEDEYFSDYVDPDEHKFEWVTDVDTKGNPVLDEDGNERKYRRLKAEYMYGDGEEEEPEQEWDLSDPLQKAIWEQEQRYK